MTGSTRTRWRSSHGPCRTTGPAWAVCHAAHRPFAGSGRPAVHDHQALPRPAFLATARQHRLFAFFHVAAYTGARRSEVLNLRWTDGSLDGKKITITGSTAVIAGERINGTTKSDRTRAVSIDEETVAMLRQHKSDKAADQFHAGDSWRSVRNGYLFTTGLGEPIYPCTGHRIVGTRSAWSIRRPGPRSTP
jgi:integrase